MDILAKKATVKVFRFLVNFFNSFDRRTLNLWGFNCHKHPPKVLPDQVPHKVNVASHRLTFSWSCSSS